MIAYLLPGANVMSAERDERMRRLSSAGPWQFQPHVDGAIATWKTDGPRFMANFSAARKTTDGMLYYPPKQMPPLESLAKPGIMQRDDASRIQVETETGVIEVRIVPAYLSPRKLLDDGTLGGFSTQYGRMVRLLLEKMNSNKGFKFSDVCDEMHACVVKGIEYSYRTTREMISDYGIINEDSIFEFWQGCIHVPKE